MTGWKRTLASESILHDCIDLYLRKATKRQSLVVLFRPTHVQNRCERIHGVQNYPDGLWWAAWIRSRRRRPSLEVRARPRAFPRSEWNSAARCANRSATECRPSLVFFRSKQRERDKKTTSQSQNKTRNVHSDGLKSQGFFFLAKATTTTTTTGSATSVYELLSSSYCYPKRNGGNAEMAMKIKEPRKGS